MVSNVFPIRPDPLHKACELINAVYGGNLTAEQVRLLDEAFLYLKRAREEREQLIASRNNL